MSINKVLNGSLSDPSRRVAALMKQMKRNIREMKTPQRIGGDVFNVQSIPDGNVVHVIGPLNLTASGGAAFSGTFIWFVTPNSQILTLWNFLPSVYVDPTIDPITGIPDVANLLGGSTASLTAGQRNCTFSPYIDWAESSDSTNMRAYKVRVVNFDSSSHAYYLAIRGYLPDINQ